MMTQRIRISAAAKRAIDRLRAKHGDLIFHQSGGCCEGSAPMCFPLGELMLNDTDVWLGRVHGCDYYTSADHFSYWRHAQIILDAVPGRGAGFSLETSLDLRFVTTARLFTERELQLLPAVTGPQPN